MGKYIGSTGLAYLWGKIKATFYQKPSGGIPKSDLSSAVQTSLGKADTALQSHQDISGKLDKITFEWNKALANGSNGKVCLGKFFMYDSNVTIELSLTTTETYNATIVIASQNLNRTTNIGSIRANVYGDENNSITPLLSIFRPNPSTANGSVEVYANLKGWSKCLVHVQAVNLETQTEGGVRYVGAYDILLNVSKIPEEISGKTKLTDDGSIGDNKVCNLLKAKYYSKVSNGTSSQFLKADGSVDSNTYLTQTTFESGNPDLKAIEAITGTAGLLKKTAANTWALDTTAYLTQSTFESGNPDLKAIEAISGTTGLLKKTAANTWTLDTAAYLTQSSFNSGNQDLAAIEALTGNSGLLKKTGANTWALDTTAYLKGSDVDSVPTAGSTKPVSSGGVHTAIAEESAARQSGDSSLSTQVSAKADKMAQVNHGTSDTTFVLTPNVLHVWDEVTSLTLTLGTGETGIVNEYLFEFHSGNTPTVLTLPSSVLWVRPLTVQAGKSYQVSIVNNLACYLTDGMGIEESQGSTPVYATQSWVTSLIEQAPAANSSKVPQSGGVYAALEGGYYAS